MTSSEAPRRARAVKSVEFFDLREPVYLLDDDARATSSAVVVWRPLGYFLLAVLWFILAVIALAVTIAVLPWRLSAEDVGPLGDAPGLVGAGVIGGLIALLIVGPVVGAICGVFVTVSVGSFLSASTYFVRSLRPSYRGEKLSFSARSRGAEATGPASLFGFGTAFSLIPVRLTRWTKIVTILTAQGLVVNVTLWVLGAWWGWFYFFTVGWLLWPAEGAAAVVCTIVSVALFAVFLYFVWRNRREYPDIMPSAYRGTPYERSWPNRPQQKAARTAKAPARKGSRTS
ncbi:hypothetical protein KNO15_06810 [Leifsonia shinshuensis]|uniref:hypothetical protein n=1 Tax=Leifsonia shinshuensis TaxID=150026 RepID=UPI001F50BD59|nr:hypothetical protein [Leifsonia shinshuensis]MCI0156404.1 hypothetical protein [Leifsonia shinshuensis]